MSEDSALGRVFREGVSEEIPRGDEEMSHVDIGVRNFQAEGIVSAQIPLRQEDRPVWMLQSDCGCERMRSESKG